MFDVIITGGRIFDGTGKPAFTGDVGITGDTITEIAPGLAKAETRRLIHAEGRMVCPGFIDTHSHSDVYVLIQPDAPSKIFQGVTTEVVGNCGASGAPLRGAYRMPSDWKDKPFPDTWQSVADYRRLLEAHPPAVNVVMLVGHNTLRGGAMGYDNRPATPEELRDMVAQLEQGMDEGARGLSSGLMYPPGMFAPAEEVATLCRAAARRDGTDTTHMRNEGSGLLEAIDEAISAARQSGVRLQISHLKTAGKANWHKIDAALERIETARAAGMDITADRYPYIASYTDLDYICPSWFMEGGNKASLARLRDPATRKKLREELCHDHPDAYWPTVVIGAVTEHFHRKYQGMPLVDVAKQLNMEPVDACLYLLDVDELRTNAFFLGMSEANMHRILAMPWVTLGSDASVRALTGPLSVDYPHPRAYGTFPRFLRMALDGKTVTVEEAVRKMTSLPAQQFRLKDRGTLARGKKADLSIINPETVRDIATFDQPRRLAEGVVLVLVNGMVALENRQMSGSYAGKLLAV